MHAKKFACQVFMETVCLSTKFGSFSFPPPTSHELQFISVTSGFTRLSMKTKYVCRGLISLFLNFHNNRTMWSTNLHEKFAGGGNGKRAQSSMWG